VICRECESLKERLRNKDYKIDELHRTIERKEEYLGVLKYSLKSAIEILSTMDEECRCERERGLDSNLYR
jgi:hypothetical protein